MPHPHARAHILNLLLADGVAGNVDFNLDPGSRLIHVSVNIGGAGPPIRVAVNLLQPRVVSIVNNTLVGGWIRGGGGSPAASGDLTWDGDILIGTDMALRFLARNNTGAVAGFACHIVVIQ